MLVAVSVGDVPIAERAVVFRVTEVEVLQAFAYAVFVAVFVSFVQVLPWP